MSSPVFLMIGRTMEQNLNCMESLIVPKNQECEVKTPGKNTPTRSGRSVF